MSSNGVVTLEFGPSNGIKYCGLFTISDVGTSVLKASRPLLVTLACRPSRALVAGVPAPHCSISAANTHLKTLMLYTEP